MKNSLVLIFIIVFISFDGFTSGSKAFLPDQFKASFVKTFKSIVTGAEVKSRGQLSYAYPSKIKLKTEDKSAFISNGSKAWKYDAPFIEGEKGELLVGPAGKYELLALLDNFKNGLGNNKLYQISYQDNDVILTMTKTGMEKLELKQVVLRSEKKINSFVDIKKIDLIDLKQTQTSYSFESIDTLVNFKSEYFEFFPPKNTNITHIK
jgi:outer membrane lipoprotein-sorting protein